MAAGTSKSKKRRGRPMLKPGAGKRYALGIRTTKAMKDGLEAAALATGRSLAQEVEIRLALSFWAEEQTIPVLGALLGSNENVGVLLLLARAMNGADQIGGICGRGSWLDDPATFGLAQRAMTGLIAALAPGPSDAPDAGPYFERLSERLSVWSILSNDLRGPRSRLPDELMGEKLQRLYADQALTSRPIEADRGKTDSGPGAAFNDLADDLLSMIPTESMPRPARGPHAAFKKEHEGKLAKEHKERLDMRAEREALRKLLTLAADLPEMTPEQRARIGEIRRRNFP